MDAIITGLLGLVIIIFLYAIQRVWWVFGPSSVGIGNGSTQDQDQAMSKWKLGASRRKTATPVIPIDDIGDSPSSDYTKAEKILRCKLAALYRIVDRLGWSELIFNHITLRTDSSEEHFLLNPYGLQYNEITASSLVKVDLKGNTVGAGSTSLGVNVAGFNLHSAIHEARPDLKCVIHHHHPAVVAISTLKCGLLPVCQETAIIGEVGYHDYNGIVVDPTEKSLIIQNLGPTRKILFLRNHGVVCGGATVEEAFVLAYLLAKACETQMGIMPMGLENVIVMSDEARKRAYHTVHSMGGVNSKDVGMFMDDKSKAVTTRKWGYGELEFEALMRELDNEGYRTGHIYRQTLTKNY